MRLAILAAVALVLVADPSIAEACGYWNLEKTLSKKDNRVAHVLVHRVRVGKRAFRVKHIGLSYEAYIGDKPWATFENDELRRKGKIVGRLKGDTLTVGGRDYTIRFAPLSGDHPSPYFASLSVSRGDKEVFSSPRVMSFSACGDKPMTLIERQEDVLSRLAFILLRIGTQS